MENKTLDSLNRNFSLKTLDYLLYLATFGGITFIAGSIVHALEFSPFSAFLFVLGLIISPLATVLRDKWSSPLAGQTKTFETYLVIIITSVSSGIVAGGILHWQESPRFGLYLVISGLVMSLCSNFLYNTKNTRELLEGYLINLAMFSGISFISGSVVHAATTWFNNFSLIIVGLVLTPGAIILKEKLYGQGSGNGLIANTLILVFLSLGVGAITGGVLHFNINITYAIKLIVIGTIISFTAAMFKKNGSLADLRK